MSHSALAWRMLGSSQLRLSILPLPAFFDGLGTEVSVEELEVLAPSKSMNKG